VGSDTKNKDSLIIALELAGKGFYVMPLVPQGKTPIMKGAYRTYATRDSEMIVRMFTCPLTQVVQPFNVGINTDQFGEDEALVVVDVDEDDEKDIHGIKTLTALQTEGRSFPKTLMQKTPRGGYHLIYRAKKGVKQGAGALGKGLDIRSMGGLIVAYGFVDERIPIVDCPEWIKEKREESEVPVDATSEHEGEGDIVAAENYIIHQAPFAEYGNIHDVSYQVASRLIDLGLSPEQCRQLMDRWSLKKCNPHMTLGEIESQIRSAFNYRKTKPGSALPENNFEPIDDEVLKNDTQNDKTNDPVLKYNEEFAFCLEGGSSTILWETTDIDDRFYLDRLKLTSYHERFASDKVKVGEVWKPATKVWLAHPERRTYDRVVFAPGIDVPKSHYNLWSGFSETPIRTDEKPTQQMQDGVGAFLEHMKENICVEDFEFKWLLSFFAHLIQSPGEKPLVALVIRGPKGTGKDSLIDRVGHLISRYYVMASDPRFLYGNFNAHLEHCLLLTLNEAFWSGDKKAEGILKNLITGNKHLIERKGKEVVAVKNFTRVVILGNERWMVPATADERRFAVFDIGEKRRGDTKFFYDMRKNMEAGGYKYLLRYLIDYKIDADINIAPNNTALLNQKIEALGPMQQWWRDCLEEGYILGYPVGGESWPQDMGCEDLRAAFYRDCKDRGIRSWLPSATAFGREILPLTWAHHYRKRDGNDLHYRYKIPTLEDCRAKWDKMYGMKSQWPVVEELSDEGYGLD
jgi:hypothetical protein